MWEEGVCTVYRMGCVSMWHLDIVLLGLYITYCWLLKSIKVNTLCWLYRLFEPLDTGPWIEHTVCGGEGTCIGQWRTSMTLGYSSRYWYEFYVYEDVFGGGGTYRLWVRTWTERAAVCVSGRGSCAYGVSCATVWVSRYTSRATDWTCWYWCLMHVSNTRARVWIPIWNDPRCFLWMTLESVVRKLLHKGFNRLTVISH